MSIFVIGCGGCGQARGRIADLLGKHEAFDPHRLLVEETEYMTLPTVLKQQYKNVEFGADEIADNRIDMAVVNVCAMGTGKYYCKKGVGAL